MSYVFRIPCFSTADVEVGASYIAVPDLPGTTGLCGSAKGPDPESALRELARSVTCCGPLRCAPELAAAAKAVALECGEPSDPVTRTWEHALRLFSTLWLRFLEPMPFDLVVAFIDAFRELDQSEAVWRPALARPLALRFTGIEAGRSVGLFEVHDGMPGLWLLRDRKQLDHMYRMVLGGMGFESGVKGDLLAVEADRFPREALRSSREALGLRRLYLAIHARAGQPVAVTAEELIAMQLAMRALASLADGRGAARYAFEEWNASLELEVLPAADVLDVPTGTARA